MLHYQEMPDQSAVRKFSFISSFPTRDGASPPSQIVCLSYESLDILLTTTARAISIPHRHLCQNIAIQPDAQPAPPAGSDGKDVGIFPDVNPVLFEVTPVGIDAPADAGTAAVTAKVEGGAGAAAGLLGAATLTVASGLPRSRSPIFGGSFIVMPQY